MPGNDSTNGGATSGSATNMATVPRPSSSLVAFWAVAGAGVLLLGDTVVRGNWAVFALSVAPVGLVVWALWLVLYRPRISFDARHVIVVNPGRIVDVPWQRVENVRQRFQLLLELHDGSTITCWGSPFPEKPGRTRADPAKRRGTDVAGPLEAARSRASETRADAPVTKRWDVPVLVLGAVLFVACVAELAIAR